MHDGLTSTWTLRNISYALWSICHQCNSEGQKGCKWPVSKGHNICRERFLCSQFKRSFNKIKSNSWYHLTSTKAWLQPDKHYKLLNLHACFMPACFTMYFNSLSNTWLNMRDGFETVRVHSDEVRDWAAWTIYLGSAGGAKNLRKSTWGLCNLFLPTRAWTEMLETEEH